MADILDSTLEYQRGKQSPLQYMAQQRNAATDRRQKEEMSNLQIQAKKRDAADRANLSPAYEQWSMAPQGKAGAGQRKSALQTIGGIDPKKAQNMQKGQADMQQAQVQRQKTQVEIQKKIYDMKASERTAAAKKAAGKAATFQWLADQGEEKWNAAGLKDAKGQSLPFSRATEMITKSKMLSEQFDFYKTASAKKTALMQDVPYIAKTLKVSEKEAMEIKMAGKEKSETDRRVFFMGKLMDAAYTGSRLEQELEKMMRMARGGKTDSANPLGL